MKTTLLTGFLLMSILNGNTQDACQALVAKTATINQLKGKLKTSYTATTYQDIRKASGLAAALYEECLNSQSHLPQKDMLTAYYQIGKYYYDAGNCTSSSRYFYKCLDMGICTSTMFNTTPNTYREVIEDWLEKKSCYTNKTENNAGLKVIKIKVRYHDGKALYSEIISEDAKELKDRGNNSDIPYLSDEIDDFEKRLFPLSDSAQAMQYFQTMIGTHATYHRLGPFLIINTNGSTLYNAQEDNQDVIGNYLEETTITIGSQHTENKIIERLLADSLFHGLSFKYIMPLYLYNGAYTNKDYSRFQSTAEKIHLRNPGKKIGYYNPYDKSIMVWLASGYGTFAHELSHLLIHEAYPTIPHWLDEGMASLQEEMQGAMPLDNWRLVYIKAFKEKYHGYLSLQQIVEGDQSEDTDAGLLYDCFDRYFCKFAFELGKLKQIFAYINTLKGKPVDENFYLSVFSMKREEMERFFYQWLDQRQVPAKWNYSSFHKSVARTVDGISIAPELITAHQAAH